MFSQLNKIQAAEAESIITDNIDYGRDQCRSFCGLWCLWEQVNTALRFGQVKNTIPGNLSEFSSHVLPSLVSSVSVHLFSLHLCIVDFPVSVVLKEFCLIN